MKQLVPDLTNRTWGMGFAPSQPDLTPEPWRVQPPAGLGLVASQRINSCALLTPALFALFSKFSPWQALSSRALTLSLWLALRDSLTVCRVALQEKLGAVCVLGSWSVPNPGHGQWSRHLAAPVDGWLQTRVEAGREGPEGTQLWAQRGAQSALRGVCSS